jgi:hypothetical protein
LDNRFNNFERLDIFTMASLALDFITENREENKTEDTAVMGMSWWRLRV